MILIKTNLPKIFKDPRLSLKQKQVAEQAVKADPKAVILGIDGRNRPVIQAMVGIPNRLQTWAILRNGDPTDVKWQDDVEGHLAEPWNLTGKSK